MNQDIEVKSQRQIILARVRAGYYDTHPAAAVRDIETAANGWEAEWQWVEKHLETEHR